MKGSVPPVADKVAVPSQVPLQATSVAETDTKGAPELPTGVLPNAVHPFASVTVTLYVPAAIALAVSFVCTAGSSHRYVKGAAPFVTDTEAIPSDAPQLACVDDNVRDIAIGSNKLKAVELTHPLSSIRIRL